MGRRRSRRDGSTDTRPHHDLPLEMRAAVLDTVAYVHYRRGDAAAAVKVEACC